MFDRLLGWRANLRLFYLWPLGLCLLMGGCVNIDIETRVSPSGAAIRRFNYEFDTGSKSEPGYRIGPLRMADLGLEGLSGVTLLDSSVYKKNDSITVSSLSCQAKHLNNLSQPDDSISLTMTTKGLWVYYRYYERYRLGESGRDQELFRTFPSKRFRHRLRLPGRVIQSNGDSLAGGWVVWSRSLFSNQQWVVMEAESKALNLKFFLWLGFAAAVAAILAFWRLRKGTASKAIGSTAVIFLMFLLGSRAEAIGRRPIHYLDPTEASQGAIRFFIQPAVFQGTPQRATVEISYALPLDNLQFLIADSIYRAGYFISVQAFDMRNKQVAGDYWEREIKIGDYANLGRERQIYADTLKLMIPPGKYRLRVVLGDRNSEKRGVIERPIEIGDFFSRKVSMGGVRFEREQDGDFLPWARKTYGGDFGAIILQLRLYAVEETTVLTEYTIWEEGRRSPAIVLRDTHLVAGEALVRKKIDVDSLGPGICRIAIGSRTLEAPSINLGRFEEAVHVGRYGATKRWEIEYSVEVLHYIATRKELKPIEKALPQDRDSLIEEFWLRRDPTPGTVRNEAREEFYQRVDQANRQFSLGVRPGWRTDRGRIYIKYGPPDDIEKHPFDPDYPAYEIWTYYVDGVQFMFMDIHGYGEYKLMNPKMERK